MCQVDSNEAFKGGYHNIIPSYEQNNTSKHLCSMLPIINKLELIIREHELLSIHQITYTSHELTKHVHMNEYIYKNENK